MCFDEGGSSTAVQICVIPVDCKAMRTGIWTALSLSLVVGQWFCGTQFFQDFSSCNDIKFWIVINRGETSGIACGVIWAIRCLYGWAFFDCSMGLIKIFGKTKVLLWDGKFAGRCGKSCGSSYTQLKCEFSFSLLILRCSFDHTTRVAITFDKAMLSDALLSMVLLVLCIPALKQTKGNDHVSGEQFCDSCIRRLADVNRTFAFKKKSLPWTAKTDSPAIALLLQNLSWHYVCDLLKFNPACRGVTLCCWASQESNCAD